MDSFCSQLSGEVLAACMAIPERCVSLKAPPFVQVIGEPQLFVRIQQVVQEARLGAHDFFVLGPGRGTTATRETAMASSRGRKVVHWADVIADGRFIGDEAQRAARAFNGAVASYVRSLRDRSSEAATSTAMLWPTLLSGLRTMLVEQNISGLFDSPWDNLFSELYLAMCTRGVRVVFSTRGATAWAASRVESHGGNATNFVCPFAEDPRLLDPFSWPQCAAMARRYTSAGGADSDDAPEAAPRRLPGGKAAYHFNEISERALGVALEKYNSYVIRLVPDDLLLEVNFFSSALNAPKPGSNVSPRDEWTWLEMQLIAAFTRDGAPLASPPPPPPLRPVSMNTQ